MLTPGGQERYSGIPIEELEAVFKPRGINVSDLKNSAEISGLFLLNTQKSNEWKDEFEDSMTVFGFKHFGVRKGFDLLTQSLTTDVFFREPVSRDVYHFGFDWQPNETSRELTPDVLSIDEGIKKIFGYDESRAISIPSRERNLKVYRRMPANK